MAALSYMKPPQADESYFDLIRSFPLQSIHNEGELDRAITVIDELLDRSDLTAWEQEYLNVLGCLVEDYEEEHIQFPAVSGVDVLRHLMQENTLTQAYIANIFGTTSIVSEVLSGKRSLALNHIRRLSDHFGVPADVFID